MKYMLLIYSPEDAWTPEEWTSCVVKSSGICHELAAKGQFMGAAPLHPVATASTARVRDGQKLITTGPFAETTEQLGGYYVIDVPNLDDAIAIAARLPPAQKGTVEIRPIQPAEGLPVEKSAIPLQAADPSLKQFMFLCYDDENYWKAQGQSEHLAAIADAVAITHELDAQGRFLCASPLRESSTATCVRVRNEQRIVTDGPFTETREVLGGYYLILAHTLDEALQTAARHPGLRAGAVEVRQVHDLPPIPIPGPHEILSHRDLPFSPAEVFDCYQNAERLARWWGPAGFRNTFEVFEFREGGHWKFVMHGPDGKDYDNHWIFRIVTPQRIEGDHLSAPRFTMTHSLTELPGGHTRLVWRCTFESVEIRNAVAKFAIEANQQNFDRLETELKRKP